MKPREDGGVVDSRLNVYDLKNLKVAGTRRPPQLYPPGLNSNLADMSIAPGNVGANTYSTAVAIGEKAAVIIGEELGIKGV